MMMRNDLTTEQLKQPVNVTLPLGTVLRLAESEPAPIRIAVKRDLPAIGADYEGGKYAGVSIENEQPVALVLLGGEAEDINWKDAGEWALKQGGVLPSRIDQLVLFKHLKSEFKETWYWSGEQYAGSDAYAWCQGFGYGGQGNGRKGYNCRARAVRRVKI
jgi:hypothetical protein